MDDATPHEGQGEGDAVIEREIDEIRQRIGAAADEFHDFDDWYADLRQQYGRPSDAAMDFLLDGDFAAFEQLVRDGYQPPLR